MNLRLRLHLFFAVVGLNFTLFGAMDNMNLLKRITAVAFFFTACAQHSSTELKRQNAARAERVEMNDAAFLMPLPANVDEIANTIGLETKGTYGDVMPVWLWDKMPTLRTGMLRQEVKKELRLVAVRVDPCFREGENAANSECQPQIRLVMQPVFFDDDKNFISTRDTAVHLFYKVAADDLLKFVESVQKLSHDMRDAFRDKPVDVFPLIAKHGYTSAVYRSFRTLILQHIGEFKLTRTTFMTVAGLDVQWTFGGFDIVSERVKSDIIIPGTIGRIRQTLTSDTSFPVPMFSDIVSSGTSVDNLSMFGAGAALLKQPIETQAAAIFALHRVENPQFHNPGTMDCISCHLATMARAWSVEKGLPSATKSVHSYEPLNPIQNLSQANPRSNVLRAFGYFRNKSAISSRTLNEIDATLRYLNR